MVFVFLSFCSILFSIRCSTSFLGGLCPRRSSRSAFFWGGVRWLQQKVDDVLDAMDVYVIIMSRLVLRPGSFVSFCRLILFRPGSFVSFVRLAVLCGVFFFLLLLDEVSVQQDPSGFSRPEPRRTTPVLTAPINLV